jgi:hypothetical protein
MSVVIDRMRRAIVKQGMAEGIEDPDVIASIADDAIGSIGDMSVAGYKAVATRRRKAIRKKTMGKWADSGKLVNSIYMGYRSNRSK